MEKKSENKKKPTLKFVDRKATKLKLNNFLNFQDLSKINIAEQPFTYQLRTFETRLRIETLRLKGDFGDQTFRLK